MQVQANLPIPNTLALPATAQLGTRATSTAEVIDALAYAKRHKLNFLALGEGSNVIATRSVEKFVCLMALTGMQTLSETDENVVLRIAAGENWHEIVTRTLAQDCFGLENLALIPGSVGAAPVQNIGAYGVEIASFVVAVEVLDAEGKMQLLDKQACQFSYRDSIFKRNRHWVITAVHLRLNKRPNVVIEYPELREQLSRQGIAQPAPEDVFAAVQAIRRAKLPDVNKAPNVGSFFKNPVLSLSTAQILAKSFPWLKTFALPDVSEGELVKLSAAQLIDQLGWKDKPAERVMCWHSQPLVLVNRGKADSDAVLNFAFAIRDDVLAHFGVHLELEPSLLS